MVYIYIVFLTLFVSLCCLKYFDVAVGKMKVLCLIGVSGCLCIGHYFHLPAFIQLLLRDLIIYGMVKSEDDQAMNIEMIAMILFLETMAKCSYYVFVLFVPLIVDTSIADALMFHNYWLQIVVLLVLLFLLQKYYHSSAFLKMKCDRITYALLTACSLISIYGLDIIPTLGHRIDDYQLYFLLLAFVYVVVFNIIIYIYHNLQVQKETSHRIALEQLQLLKQEKDMIAIQKQMIDNIKHDLKYFQSMVNRENNKHISRTLKKIDEYDQRFLFNDYLLNNFIYRMKSEMKDHNKDLKMIITDINIKINLNIYNQLLEVMAFVIADSLKAHIQFRLQCFDEMTVFEFTYISNHHKLSSSLVNRKNVIISQNSQEYTTCSLIMEGA